VTVGFLMQIDKLVVSIILLFSSVSTSKYFITNSILCAR
jgi:hypothetical protein